MYGPHAVTLPADAGGRSPADQGVRTPYGDLPPQATDALNAADAFNAPEAAPWPAALPAPARPRSPASRGRPRSPTPQAARSGSAAGCGSPPARRCWRCRRQRERLPIRSWAGPWPLAERWWEPAAAVRRARFQAVTDDGRAWLLAVRDGHWFIEAVYD